MATTNAKSSIDIKAVRALIDYLAEIKSIRKFSYQGLEVEFDTFTEAVTKADPEVLDKMTKKISFEDLKKQEESELFWSAGK